MPDITIFMFAAQANIMRDSQKAYFELIKKAKQTRLPADFDAAKKALEISKKAEIVFDDTVTQILNLQ